MADPVSDFVSKVQAGVQSLQLHVSTVMAPKSSAQVAPSYGGGNRAYA